MDWKLTARRHANEEFTMIIRVGIFMLLVGMIVAAPPVQSDSLQWPGCGLSYQSSKAHGAVSSAIQKDSFTQAYNQAECLRKAAARQRNEWLETETLLLKARQQEENGQHEAAMRWVNKARNQSILALKQAENEAIAWKHRVLE